MSVSSQALQKRFRLKQKPTGFAFQFALLTEEVNAGGGKHFPSIQSVQGWVLSKLRNYLEAHLIL